MEWSILIGGAVCAVVAIVIAYAVDSGRAQRRRQLLTTAPDRPLLADQAAPTYLMAEDIRANRDQPAPVLSESSRQDLAARLAEATSVAAGWPSPDFITDPDPGWAVLESPVVLVAETVTQMSDLMPVIASARTKDAPLVIAAAGFSPEVLATMSLNSLSGRLRGLCVVTDDLDSIAEAVAASVVESLDLTAGFIPTTSLGHCEIWISDSKQSWIFPTASTR